MRKYGPTASAVFSEILSVVYRGEGYFCKVDNDLFEDVAEAIFCPDSNLVAQIINDFVQAGLFDQNIYNRKRVLTSAAIQKRVLEMAVWRKDYQIDPELLLVSPNKPKVNHRETSGKPLGNPGLPTENQDKTMGNPGLPPGKPRFPSPKEKRREEKVNSSYNPSLSFIPESATEESFHQEQPSEPDTSDLSGQNRSLTGDKAQPGKTYQETANGDSRGNFGDSATTPVQAVVNAWNERFQGTKGVNTDFYLSPMLERNISERLKTHDLETICKVFDYARHEYEEDAKNNRPFIWTLNAMFNKKSTFDLNLEKAERFQRQKLGNQRAVMGYSDPATYASADEWANFGKEIETKYATVR